MPNDTTTLHRPRFRLSESGQAFVLRVTEGPDTGRTFVCEPSGVLPAYVGQGEGSQLVLTDREVSRRHLRLTIQDGALIVEDLRSKNGTFVNGVGIRAAVLRGGERIRMGVTELLVEAQRATPAEPVLEMAFGRLLGLSQEMRRLYPLFQKLAGSSVPFAIEGEAGTGKELLAEVIHEQGERAERPFVVFDCTAVSANLAESELFGSDGRKGLFELAHTGTLFIDEIADLDLSLQPKLLRAIERGQIRRVGSEKTIEVNVRLIVSSLVSRSRASSYRPCDSEQATFRISSRACAESSGAFQTKSHRSSSLDGTTRLGSEMFASFGTPLSATSPSAKRHPLLVARI